MTRLGQALQQHRAAQAAEIVLVFLLAAAVISVGWQLVGDNSLARQAVVWVANVLMLITIWIGLRLRGQTWQHFGLSFRFAGWRALARTILQSFIVFVVALAAYVAGGMAMTKVAGGGQTADMSGYDYLRGNLPLLLLALAAVYIVSSFGEEVLYRGFLINRFAEIGRGGQAAFGLAVVASALVFGLAHFAWGIVGIVQTAVLGLALAVCYQATKRNLWALILAHVYMDTLLLVQMYAGGPTP